jgi:hypothetical protein
MWFVSDLCKGNMPKLCAALLLTHLRHLLVIRDEALSFLLLPNFVTT